MNQQVQNASMARTLEFDRPHALNRVLALFWRKGDQASPLADLLAATGIGRSSFDAAFTDQRSLFIECLDLFAARTADLAAMLMLFNEGIRVSSRRRLPDGQYLQPIGTTFRPIRS